MILARLDKSKYLSIFIINHLRVIEMFRKSKKREKILEILRNTRSHPTAEWVYNEIRKEFPRISLGSVYRNLNVLIEQKLIKKVGTNESQERFDATTDQHYHFVCKSCNKILDIEKPVELDLDKEFEKNSSFKIAHHNLTFYGLCPACVKSISN